MNTQPGPNVSLEEYKTLRDETLKRVDARNQILSYTLVFAAAMFSLAFGTNAYASASLVYPIVAFFFALGFVYNSLMLIQIGAYIRYIEANMQGLGWATYLKPRYTPIEFVEWCSTAGLFIGTEVIGLILYSSLDAAKQNASRALVNFSYLAIALTVAIFAFSWIYHRHVLRTTK